MNRPKKIDPAKISIAPPPKAKLRGKPLTKYSFSDSAARVEIYVEIANVGVLDPSLINLAHTASSFTLTVGDDSFGRFYLHVPKVSPPALHRLLCTAADSPPLSTHRHHHHPFAAGWGYFVGEGEAAKGISARAGPCEGSSGGLAIVAGGHI